MAIILCSKHGGQRFGLACEHIHAAMRAEQPLKFAVWREWIGDLWVCDECLRSGRLPRIESFDDDEVILDGLDSEFVDNVTFPCCPKCFEEWRQTLGQSAESTPSA